MDESKLDIENGAERVRGSEEEEEEEAVASGPGQWVSTLAAHAPTHTQARARAHATSPHECKLEELRVAWVLEVCHMHRPASNISDA